MRHFMSHLFPMPLFDVEGGGGATPPAPSTPPAAPPATPPATPPAQQTPPATTPPTPNAAPAQTTPPATPPVEPEFPPHVQEAINKRISAEVNKLQRDYAQREATLRAEYEQRFAPPQISDVEGDPYAFDDEAELAKINESLQDLMTQNPIKAMAEGQRILAERRAAHEAKVQQAWTDMGSAMRRAYPDFDQMRPAMLEVLKLIPSLEDPRNPQSLHRIYQVAKALAERPAAAPDPAALLSDQTFLSQAGERLLQDPTFLGRAKEMVAAQVIQEYIDGKRQASPPPVMGSTTGSQAPAMPPQVPRTWGAARQSALNR